jgi:hypothetical protein
MYIMFEKDIITRNINFSFPNYFFSKLSSTDNIINFVFKYYDKIGPYRINILKEIFEDVLRIQQLK